MEEHYYVIHMSGVRDVEVIRMTKDVLIDWLKSHDPRIQTRDLQLFPVLHELWIGDAIIIKGKLIIPHKINTVTFELE